MVTFIKGLDKVSDWEVQKKVISILNPQFGFDITKRVRITSDVNQFNPDADPIVWKQAKGQLPHVHEIYWDDVWICDFHEAMPGYAVLHDFLVGFKNAYEAEQISINEKAELEREELKHRADEVVKQQQEKQKKADEAIENLPDRTEDEKLAKQAITEVNEEKKEKRRKVAKKQKDLYGI